MYNSRITNPVSEKMVYDADGHQIVNMYDAAGQKYRSIIYTNIASAHSQQYDFANYSFETGSLPAGLYFLRLIVNGKVETVEKIIKIQ